MMGYGWGYGLGAGFWIIGGLALFVGLALLVGWIIGTVSQRGRGPIEPRRPTPSEILRERFARGEITEQEFEQAKKVLGPDQ